MSEQGLPSEVTAAVLNRARREGDGCGKSCWCELLPCWTGLISARPNNRPSTRTAASVPSAATTTLFILAAALETRKGKKESHFLFAYTRSKYRTTYVE